MRSLVRFCSASLLLVFVGCNTDTAGRYTISVESAEVASAKPNDEPWDGDKSAPDVFYEIWWEGNRIFKSSPKTDTTLPTWSDTEINLGEIMRSGTVKTRDNSATVGGVSGVQVVLKFFDKDLLDDDLIDTVVCDLHEGTFSLSGAVGTVKSCKVRVGRE